MSSCRPYSAILTRCTSQGKPVCLLLLHISCITAAQWQNASHATQEVQLYTAEPDQNALTMGLRAPTMSPASASPKLPSDSQQPDKQNPSVTTTHCSASSLHVHQHRKGLKQQHQNSASASDGVKPVGRPTVHEVSADSEEEKTSSSVGRGSRSLETSSAPTGPCGPCGPCGASFSKREGSGELQSVSGGTFLIDNACISMQRGRGVGTGVLRRYSAYIMLSGFHWFIRVKACKEHSLVVDGHVNCVA